MPKTANPREFRELAKGSWRQGQLENADLLLDQVIDGTLPPVELVKWCVTKATVQTDKGQPKKALELLGKAAPFVSCVDAYVHGTFLSERGRARARLFEIDSAFTDYAGADSYLEQAGHATYRGAVALNQADLYLKIGDYEQCGVYTQRAIEIFEAADSEYASQAYETKANLLLAQGELETALAVIDRGIRSIVNNDAWLVTCLITRGKIRCALGDAGREDLNRAVELSRETGNKSGMEKACRAIVESLDLPLTEATINGIRTDLIRKALIETEGSVTRSAKMVGMSHHGLSHVIKNSPELSRLRKIPRIRRKSLMKK